MVGRHPVEALGACRDPTENIAAADNDGNLHAEPVHILDLARNTADDLRLNPE